MNHAEHRDPAAERDELEGEEHVEEIFRQLWAIPNSEAARVPHPGYGSVLVWIRKDLVSKRRIQSEDCYPVSRNYRIEKPLTRLDFARDIWAGGGERAIYVEILKKRLRRTGTDGFGSRISQCVHQVEVALILREDEVLPIKIWAKLHPSPPINRQSRRGSTTAGSRSVEQADCEATFAGN
jgi:hypothetical protein